MQYLELHTHFSRETTTYQYLAIEKYVEAELKLHKAIIVNCFEISTQLLCHQKDVTIENGTCPFTLPAFRITTHTACYTTIQLSHAFFTSERKLTSRRAVPFFSSRGGRSVYKN